jgi:hypothetical protein
MYFVYNFRPRHCLFEEFKDILLEMSKRLHVEYQLLTFDFNKTLIFLTDFRKKPQISSFIKIRPVGSEFHADRQKDRRIRRS